MGNELDLNETIGGNGRFTDGQRGFVVRKPTVGRRYELDDKTGCGTKLSEIA